MRETSGELATLAEMALAEGDEGAIEPRLAAWLRTDPGDVLIRHWIALLRRSLDRRDEAIADFEIALRHAPGHPGITHALAHTMLEAGLPATDRFLEAIRLAPAKSDIRLGLAAARYADGEGARGLDELAALLGANAGWYDGHRKYAQLAAMVGRADDALASIEQALNAFPKGRDLYLLGIDLLLEAERYSAAIELIDRAAAQLGESDPLRWAKAAAIDECDGAEASAPLFVALGPAPDQAQAIRRIRHGLRLGNWNGVALEIESWLTRPQSENIWPYAALAWRLTDDPRGRWLEDMRALTATVDFGPAALDIPAVNTVLHGLHDRSDRFLNQSVRNGTQTDGPLFARTDPALAKVRERMRDAVADFARTLPSDSGHPALRWRRDRRPRFAGSWSVRLKGGGFHSSHHHPQGWLSGVLYLAAPDGLEAQEGQLVLGGSPTDLALPVEPLAIVPPRPGRLVIFPSYMWHGTLPYREGDRLTIAFDIARP